MIIISDVNFLLERVTEELAFADEARDPCAAHVHRQMAALYAGRLSELREERQDVASMPFIAAH